MKDTAYSKTTDFWNPNLMYILNSNWGNIPVPKNAKAATIEQQQRWHISQKPTVNSETSILPRCEHQKILKQGNTDATVQGHLLSSYHRIMPTIATPPAPLLRDTCKKP